MPRRNRAGRRADGAATSRANGRTRIGPRSSSDGPWSGAPRPKGSRWSFTTSAPPPTVRGAGRLNTRRHGGTGSPHLDLELQVVAELLPDALVDRLDQAKHV